MSLLPVDDALARILGPVTRLQSEEVALADAEGRVLADPIHARRDQPPFSASAMDGYALAGPGTSGRALACVGESQAGKRFAGALGQDQCIRIFTGAPMPEGADRVVMQEHVAREGDSVTLEKSIAAQHNVRLQGYDYRDGDQLLGAGTVMGPAQLALAASANAPRCRVVRRPRIAIVSTGDELVALGGAPGPDQIVSSNALGLCALFRRWGADPVDLGIVRDDPEALRACFAQTLAEGVDMVITTGGASVGAHDYVQDALIAAGVAIDFWRIAMRPGKPLMFGTHANALVFGLPGNPVSAIATARVMAIPALAAMLGSTAPQSWTLPLATPLPENTARRHFVRARLVGGPGDALGVQPTGETDSGHLTSLARSDGFIVQDENSPAQPQGAPITFLPL